MGANAHHPDDKLVNVVWVTQLIDEREQHTACQHLLKDNTQLSHTHRSHSGKINGWQPPLPSEHWRLTGAEELLPQKYHTHIKSRRVGNQKVCFSFFLDFNNDCAQLLFKPAGYSFLTLLFSIRATSFLFLLPWKFIPMWYFASTSSRSEHSTLLVLTLRKYLMFLLWKSPGGSNRYRSSSHKSRRKSENTHQTRFTRKGQHACVGGVSWQMWAYLPHPYVKCTPCLDKSSSPSPLQPQRTSPPAPLWCPLLRESRLFLTATTFAGHVRVIYYSVWERRPKVSRSLLCLSSLSARRSWAFRNTRKWVAKSSTRRVVK